jgi:Caspase domain
MTALFKQKPTKVVRLLALPTGRWQIESNRYCEGAVREKQQAFRARFLGLALLLAPIGVLAAPESGVQQAYRAALVIGNAHYAAVAPLKNPENDARDMCVALRSVGFTTTCAIDVPTRVQFKSLIEDFVDGVPAHSATLIYYAGHAVQISGENYLIPTKANLSDAASVASESVTLSFLMQQVGRIHAKVTIFTLDACRNNPLASSANKLPQGLADVTDIPNDTEVWYATAANKPALDGVGRNGTFTKHLLDHLHDKGTIDDLFKRVRSDVEAEAQQLGYVQRPVLYSDYNGKDDCLVQCNKLDQLELANDQLQDQERKNELRLAEKSAENEKMKKEQQEAKKRQQDSRIPPAF